MKKNLLKSGMAVGLRNWKIKYVLKETGTIHNPDGSFFLLLEEYDENLKSLLNDNLDIVEIPVA